MLSQLIRTIKMALKSTEEDWAILRACSAFQGLPVVEWCQCMEEFHCRSITTSRSLAGSEAWHPSDGQRETFKELELEEENWDPEASTSRTHQEIRIPDDPFAPGSFNPDALCPPEMLISRGRPQRGSFNTDISNDNYFPNHSRYGSEELSSFSGFLSKANWQFTENQRYVGDPFLNPTASCLSLHFGRYSPMSSRDSIASTVDESIERAANSPLNKAIVTVWFFTDHR